MDQERQPVGGGDDEQTKKQQTGGRGTGGIYSRAPALYGMSFVSGLHDSDRNAASLRLYLLCGVVGGVSVVCGGSPLRDQRIIVYGGSPVSAGSAAGSGVYSALSLGSGCKSDALYAADAVGGV